MYRLPLMTALLLGLGALACSPEPKAARPHTVREVVVRISSDALHRPMEALVLLPPDYAADTARRFPVLYLLHGYGGHFTNWTERIPEIRNRVGTSSFILVCPDGLHDSWYIDSPVDSTSRMAGFLTRELIPYVDAHFRTRPERACRAVSGLSMGGHGAYWLAIQHPRLFGAAGSMSGVMDLSRHRRKYGLEAVLGSYQKGRYRAHSIRYQLHRLDTLELALYFDCGLNDPFLPENLEWHQALKQAGVPHTFQVAPGKHDWAYWRSALPHQLLFFEQFFARPEGKSFVD